jgi:hypothetical protein
MRSERTEVSGYPLGPDRDTRGCFPPTFFRKLENLKHLPDVLLKCMEGAGFVSVANPS